jgi:hypothetical protein
VVQRLGQRFLLLPLSLLVFPSVSAYAANTGISPLNRVIDLMSQMFNLPILQNTQVQEGFLRFCLFIVFLAVAHFAFKKFFDNKTSGIISSIFALISAALLPRDWIMVNGSVISVVFGALIPLGLVGFCLYLCMKPLNQSTPGRIIAIVILLMLLAILQVFKNVTVANGAAPLFILISGRFFKRGER